MSNGNEVFVKNPHSILPALIHRPKDVIEVVMPRDASDGVWEEIAAYAQKNKVRIRDSEPVNRSQHGGKKHRGDNFKRNEKADLPFSGRESSHGAQMKVKQPTSLERMFDNITQNSRGVWLALDCLQDPQNVGAIFRSAAFFGVKGILATTERSAPMTSTVYDIASGGVEAVPYVGVINLQRAFEKAKVAGLWILGTSEHAKESLFKLKNDRPWLLVIGNEEKGIRRLTEESCDMMCTIPPQGEIVTSLNVSVASGIALGHLCAR